MKNRLSFEIRNEQLYKDLWSLGLQGLHIEPNLDSVGAQSKFQLLVCALKIQKLHSRFGNLNFFKICYVTSEVSKHIRVTENLFVWALYVGILLYWQVG